MIPPPSFWIVAGPNGAGKTTCVQSEPISRLIANTPFLNPDDITKQKLIAQGYSGFDTVPVEVLAALFVESANEVEDLLEEAIEGGASVGVETVLSTNKYLRFVERVRDLGGQFHLIYVTLNRPEIAVERVAIRVALGGHGVPSEKVVDRYRRSHANLPEFARRADAFWVIDNSGSDPTVPPVMLAYGSNGRLDFLDEHAHALLKNCLSTL